LILLVFG
jgi:hypothetical protein